MQKINTVQKSTFTSPMFIVPVACPSLCTFSPTFLTKGGGGGGEADVLKVNYRSFSRDVITF